MKTRLFEAIKQSHENVPPKQIDPANILALGKQKQGRRKPAKKHKHYLYISVIIFASIID